MDLYTVENDSGLFNLLGKLFALANQLDSVRSTGVKTKTEALQAVLHLTPEAESAIRYLAAWQGAGGSWQQQLAAVAQQLLSRYVQEKNLPPPRLRQALEILIQDLRAEGYYFSTSSRSIQVQPDPANQGDTALIITDRNRLGWPCLLLPEVIQGRIDGGQLRLVGKARKSTTDAFWPGGSEINFSITPAQIGQSLLQNADFEAENADGSPADWLIYTGTPGLTVQLTQPEKQQVEITGSPTGGYFVLVWTDGIGRQWETAPLAHNAMAPAIQTALRAIPGLDAVQVEGQGPFIITFEKTPGNIQQLSAINRLTGENDPQVVITTTRQGNPQSYRGRSLRLVGTGSEQTLLWQTVRPNRATVYGLLMRACRTSGASGTLRFELRRGVEDGILQDEAGNPNQVEISISSLPVSGHAAVEGFFRLKESEELPVTFVLHLASPLPEGESIFLDEILLAPAQRLTGGPYLLAASGWKPAEGDRFAITIQNNYAGKWEKAFDRWFSLRQQTDLALPTSGTILIPDSLLE